VYISPIWGAKTPGWIEPKFCLVVGVHDVITPLKFGDNRFRGFWLAEGQSLHFPIYFEGRPYNTHTTVWGVIVNIPSAETSLMLALSAHCLARSLCSSTSLIRAFNCSTLSATVEFLAWLSICHVENIATDRISLKPSTIWTPMAS